MIDIAIGYLRHIGSVINNVLSASIIVGVDGSATITVFGLILFYWVIWLFIYLFKQWVNKRG